jgi:succinyl-diaminopimelate desuccinylase
MGNMKGAVAAMVHALRLLAENQEHWRGRVTFTAVSDEVVFGDNGAAFLLRTHPDLLGDALLCGEGPGFRRLALGEKGVLWLEVTAEASGGHSSSVRAGASASARLATAVARIDALTGRTGTLPPDLAAVMGGSDDPGLELTANVGVLTAGTFVGQVAISGRAEVDLRLPPGVSADDAENLVRDAVADIPTVRVRRIKGWDPNWTGPETGVARAWRETSREVGAGDPEYAIRLPASDASRWRRVGIPALCYGPQPTLSAGIDDHAEEDEVIRCVSLYAGTALRLLAR